MLWMLQVIALVSCGPCCWLIWSSFVALLSVLLWSGFDSAELSCLPPHPNRAATEKLPNSSFFRNSSHQITAAGAVNSTRCSYRTRLALTASVYINLGCVFVCVSVCLCVHMCGGKEPWHMEMREFSEMTRSFWNQARLFTYTMGVCTCLNPLALPQTNVVCELFSRCLSLLQLRSCS